MQVGDAGGARRRAVALSAALLLATASMVVRADGDRQVGESIYVDGKLSSGAALAAKRSDESALKGDEIACARCHRRSGLGGRESRIVIPPITGRYLFHPTAATREDLDIPYVDGLRLGRKPYTDESLARAIRDGLGSDGKPLNVLMPRYPLGDADMAALIAYLRNMDRRRAPGIDSSMIHFATIVTPEADAVAKDAMLNVLAAFFDAKNTFPIGASPTLQSTHRMHYMVNRQWQLHVWTLRGAPDTWRAQLDDYQTKDPVFAVISGIGGAHWLPVHRFCEERRVPCLYPNVSAPPQDADGDYYSVYFTRGVGLEAGLLAKRLRTTATHGRVLQIHGADDEGAVGARSLSRALDGSGIAIIDHAPDEQLREILAATSAADSVVLWLHATDLERLRTLPPPPATVYLSGQLAGLERAALPPAWRERVVMAYPVALPDERRINLDFAFGWFRYKRIPVVDERVQVDTFLACSLLAETLKMMVDAFVPEYLLERTEDMLDHRLITGYYPRLTLGQGQRFGSKGGYLVHFAKPPARGVVAESAWTVP